ncbi:MAG: MFS transporter [Bacteroidota bacterium]|nr:MFS transporter [Candidatus Kapabacteria bacterium]MCX7936138.1 MFS transporter [Chlorobiota bacterium]MDW8074968.1 MFS transporter [Bacteroidota bacterium]
MKRRVIWAWCMYDWANSAYPLVISTALLPVYFTLVARDHPTQPVVWFAGQRWESASLYSLTVSLSYAVNAVLVPLLSGIADRSGWKKRFLNLFSTIGASACIALAAFDRSRLPIGLLALFVASVGFNGSLVFYNAFLPEIAPWRLHDRISAKGYIFGYIGSSLLLIAIFSLLLVFELTGIMPSTNAAFLAVAPWSFVAVGLWWRGFAQITLSVVPERISNEPLSVRNAINTGWQTIRRTLSIAGKEFPIGLFLVSYLAASMGVQSVILLATLFGKQQLQLAESLLVGTILLVQFVAAAGSWLCARLSEQIGNTKGLILIMLLWGIACLGAYVITTAVEFVFLSALVGLVLGGIQSQMRSTFAKMVAQHPYHASLFSLYDIAEKIGTSAGMGIFSLVVAWTGSLRQGALVLAGAFLLSIVLMLSLHRHARVTERYRRITLPRYDQ